MCGCCVMVLLRQCFESWLSPCFVGQLEFYVKTSTTVMGGAEQSEYSTRQNRLRPFTLHDMQRSEVDKSIIIWSLNAKGNLIINNIPTDGYRCKRTGGSLLRLRQIEILAWCLQVFLSLPIGCPVVRGSWHLRAGWAQSLQSIPVFLSGNQKPFNGVN